MISISYECSYTPPFIARDTLAVHHQHLEAKVALGRQAGMQEDSAVECSTEPSNINYIGSYMPSAWHLQRICSAKLQVLRKGRHGGQREKRSFAHPRSCAQKTTTLGAGERPIHVQTVLHMYSYEYCCVRPHPQLVVLQSSRCIRHHSRVGTVCFQYTPSNSTWNMLNTAGGFHCVVHFTLS